MINHTIARILVAGGAAVSVLFSGVASALDISITGFLRQEISYSISSENGNPNNTAGREYHGLITPQVTYGGAAIGYVGAGFGSGTNAFAPTTTFNNGNGGPEGGLFSGFFASGFNPAGVAPNTLLAGANTSSPVGCSFGHENAINAGSLGILGNGGGFFPGVLCPNGAGSAHGGGLPITSANSSGPSPQGAGVLDDRKFNTFNTRLDVDFQVRFNRELAGFMKTRVYYDGTRLFADRQFGDNFANPFWSERRATLTEWNTPDFLFDIPIAYLDWNRGPLWVRAGNQTIAWGEAYFFRVSDLANGLDLRRHLTLTPGAEEYQDQRVASPGVRVSYRFYKDWEIDAFAQMFQPTILPGQNTAYNVVPTSVSLDDRPGFEDAENAINFGFKVTAPLTDSFTAMAGYVNRRNPDGVFTSVDAPQFINGIVNPFCNGPNNATNNLMNTAAVFGSQAATNATLTGLNIPTMPKQVVGGWRNYNGCGTAFYPHALTAGSREYWDLIQKGRIDTGQYVTKAVEEWSASNWATREVFGFGREDNFVDLYRTLEGFRSSFGGVAQAVGRQFKRENVFFAGANYITQSENQYLDSIIIRGEVSVTPDKKLFNDLSLFFTEKDDIVSALILEKYHRITPRFPATYMVAQWMHRTATDMFGRDLDKNDSPDFSDFIDPVTGDFTPAAFVPGALTPDGNSNANYVVFAFQQPFPDLIWRVDMSLLIDTAGGYLFQPGVRYRPSASMQWDLYATVIQSPGGDNDTITETLDFADEVFLRATYFF